MRWQSISGMPRFPSPVSGTVVQLTAPPPAVFLAVPCTGFHTPHEFLAHIKGGRDKRSQMTISQRDMNASGGDPSSSSATTVLGSQCTHPVLSVPLCSRLPGCPLSLHPEGCTHQLLAPDQTWAREGEGAASGNVSLQCDLPDPEPSGDFSPD